MSYILLHRAINTTNRHMIKNHSFKNTWNLKKYGQNYLSLEK